MVVVVVVITDGLDDTRLDINIVNKMDTIATTTVDRINIVMNKHYSHHNHNHTSYIIYHISSSSSLYIYI